MICRACAQAAGPRAGTAHATTSGGTEQISTSTTAHWHDPAVCIDAGRTPADIQLHGTKCTCQHGQRGATEGNGTP